MRDRSPNSYVPANEPCHAAGFRRIAVALDGTPFAEAALPAALALGRVCNAEVVLVRAHAARGTPVHTRLGLRRHERETLGRASLYLARIEQDFLAHGVRATSVSPVGRAVDTLVELAGRHCDLVLIATHASGSGHSSQLSVAHELAMRGNTPLLLVSPASQGVLSAAGDALSVVLALDSERRDMPALHLAAALTSAFAGRLLVVFSTSHAVWQPGPPTVPAQLAAEVEAVRADLAHRGVAAWTVVGTDDVLTEVAHLPHDEHKLIVLGLHGTVARRQAIADGAMSLLRGTGVAILLVPQVPLPTLGPCGRSTSPVTGGAV